MAYQNFRNGFNIQTASAVDKRILLSREEMLEAEDVYELPDHYFSICTDDGKLYLYDASAPKDPVYGKYREVNADLAERLDDVVADVDDVESKVATLTTSLGELSDELRGDIADLNSDISNVDDKLQTLGDDLIAQINALNDELENKIDKEDLAVEIPDALKKALSDQSKGSGLIVDSEGNISVALDDNYLKVNDSNEITFTDFIIQSV